MFDSTHWTLVLLTQNLHPSTTGEAERVIARAHHPYCSFLTTQCTDRGQLLRRERHIKNLV